MSFGSGSLLDVGTLVSAFTLDATGAKATISSINQSADQIKNAFGNVTFKLDASQAQGAITQLTAATAAFKDAQTQATLALAGQRTTLTGTKAALDQQRTATEQARTATAGNTAALLSQRTATEAARTSLVQTRAELTQLALAEKQAAQEAQNSTSSFSGLKRSLELIGGLAIFGVLVKGASDLKDAIFGTNAAIEQAQLKFTALSGSAQTATTLMGQLETLAAHSTFGLTQITAAAGGLEAFGVNVQNIPPLLNAMQNAAAAAGGDMAGNFTNLARILGELAGGLPLTERQIRQLVTAGIPLQPLADQLGITVNQLLDVGKTGIVTGDQLVAAFAKVYTSGNLGDFMQKQAGTFNGALALIKTNLSLAAATAFRPLFDVVSNLAVKFGEFVQTATFNEWVRQISAGMNAVIGLFKEFAAILAPVGDAVAKFFGLNTGNIGAQMDAVKNATVDVGTYNASLQGSGAAANDNKAALQGYKDQVDAASAALLGLNGQLADNQVLLDGNARSIAAVKNQYDPIIKSAEQSIRDINTPTADELARKTQELQLDRDRANLELTKPNTSVFDARILTDQTTLDTMPRLDTSGWDTTIANAQASLETLQDSDPSAGLKSQIASIQDAMSNLNTDALDEKINHIKDVLSQPAPDTHGITNQLVDLNAQLAGGEISQSQFDTRFGTLSRQKQGIDQAYTDQTSGLSGQLQLLERQRSDQALANKETAQADRQRIADLQDQVKIADAGHKKDVADLQDYIKAQEKGRSDATAADAKARQALQDDIRQEGNLRANALAPYTEALKKITDAQAINSAKDAAAAAQRALDLAPYQQALDKAKATEDSLLAPLLAQKQIYDDTKTSLTEARQQQELAKQAAEGQATALKDAAANAKLLGQNLNPPGGPAKAALPLGGGAATAALGVGAHLGSQLDPSPFVQFVDTVTAKLHELTTSDDWSVVFTGKHKDGTPVSTKERWDTAITDILGGFDGIDSSLQSWIKNHDADGMWGVLIYGKNPDGSTATAKEQLGVFFGGINYFITQWLSENGPKWLTSWTQIGTDLGKAWDGPDNFNWTTIGRTLGATNTGIDGWLGDHAPKWLTSWNSLGSDLQKAWDGPDSFNWTAIGHFFSDIAAGIDKFGSDHFPVWLTSWQGLAGGLGKVFDGLAEALKSPLSAAGNVIEAFLGGIGKAVSGLGKLFGIDALANFSFGSGSSASPGPLGNGQQGPAVPPAFLATGTLGWQGGAAIVGEAGRELINRSGRPISDTAKWELASGPTLIPDLPRGATVLPNNVTEALLAQGVPGFAGGLVGDVLSGIGSLVGHVTKGAADAMLNFVPDLNLPGMFAGVGTALVKDAKDGLGNLIGRLLGHQSSGSTHAGGGIAGAGDLIDAILAVTGDKGEQMAMLMGAALETGMRNVAQIGGGPGAGYWQIEAGPGGQYAGQVDPYDAAAAARFMEPQYAAAMGAFDASNLESSLTNVAYGAERPARFYGSDQIANAWSLIQPFLINGGIAAPTAAGPFQSGGWPDVIATANTLLGDGGFNECERWVGDVLQAAGYSHPRYATALDDDRAAANNSGTPPFGATVLWGFGPAGHVAFGGGDGSFLGTVNANGGAVGWQAAGTYGDPDGWRPPGLADGAFFPANTPTLAMVGEGRNPEITAPVPMLKQTMRDVIQEQGGAPTLIFQPGAITVDQAGTVTVNPARINVLHDALRQSGANI